MDGADAEDTVVITFKQQPEDKNRLIENNYQVRIILNQRLSKRNLYYQLG